MMTYAVKPKSEPVDERQSRAPWPVVVIGAGQAGLSTGYFLQEYGLDFTILADDERVGDSWRNRWDSLRLFTPAFYNGLPGMEFPADEPDNLPEKDDVAEYLERYAETFDLPVQLETRVTRLQREKGSFLLTAKRGQVRAYNVVVATGAYRHPNLPAVADQVSPEIGTWHSSEYQNPAQLNPGNVLVVGAGNSGTQIATEIALDGGGREVWLVGPDTGRLPRRLLGRDIYRWLGPTLIRLGRTSFLGRRLYEKVADGGDPVFKNEHQKMQDAGVNRVVGRIGGVADGCPTTGDGERFDASNVIWCTGFVPDFSWIDLDIFDEDGSPRHTRGVVEEAPGLYFVGYRWLHRLDSSLLGGVGNDARHVARRIRKRVRDGDGAGPIRTVFF